MTHRLDDEAVTRELRDAVAGLEPPALAPDTFARIAARRANGERFVLATVDAPASMSSRRLNLVAGTLAALAAMVIIGVALNLRRDSAITSVASRDQFAITAADSACASSPETRDPSMLRHLMIGAFGVSVACGAQPIPDAPITVAPSQILSGTFTYRGLTITDAVFTSVHAPTTISISRVSWHGASALLAVRVGPLITRVSVDSLTVSATDLAPLHWASWYPTQHPVGAMHADFDSSMVTIVMTGRFDTVATFSYPRKAGELPFGWTQELVVPALPLTNGWHGTLQIALPIHPHAYKLLGKPWESMALRVVGRERITVAAGTFDCWKVQVGEPEDKSLMWVDASTHVVIRSQTTHRFGDTSFEDQVDLQRMILITQ
jgi:hypothetical protein